MRKAIKPLFMNDFMETSATTLQDRRASRDGTALTGSRCGNKEVVNLPSVMRHKTA
jgi:hypothetical protein